MPMLMLALLQPRPLISSLTSKSLIRNDNAPIPKHPPSPSPPPAPPPPLSSEHLATSTDLIRRDEDIRKCEEHVERIRFVSLLFLGRSLLGASWSGSGSASASASPYPGVLGQTRPFHVNETASENSGAPRSGCSTAAGVCEVKESGRGPTWVAAHCSVSESESGVSLSGFGSAASWSRGGYQKEAHRVHRV
ncbi:hypothetical protein CPB84DRAFT_1841934 [Gymnopilus junonius]|uniref:Uncharacterized protein n=1 Tax=Gymnopilus junonius TaxID=109634 RepID=A0A9P5P0R6_GYMJU|nr:hypothetical protein CPB84DRAFT_1841934 [Gymnopilus junonius]